MPGSPSVCGPTLVVLQSDKTQSCPSVDLTSCNTVGFSISSAKLVPLTRMPQIRCDRSWSKRVGRCRKSLSTSLSGTGQGV